MSDVRDPAGEIRFSQRNSIKLDTFFARLFLPIVFFGSFPLAVKALNLGNLCIALNSQQITEKRVETLNRFPGKKYIESASVGFPLAKLS